MDEKDPLKDMRKEFYIPKTKTNDIEHGDICL
jgi:hypothetical protein